MDLYEILDVSPWASTLVIEQAYKKKMISDSKSNQHRLYEYNTAYKILMNPDKKRFYDRFGDAFINFLLEEYKNWAIILLYSLYNIRRWFPKLLILNILSILVNFIAGPFSEMILVGNFYFTFLANSLMIILMGIKNITELNKRKKKSLTARSLKTFIFNFFITQLTGLYCLHNSQIYYYMYPAFTLILIIFYSSFVIYCGLWEESYDHSKSHNYAFQIFVFIILLLLNFDFMIIPLFICLLVSLILKIYVIIDLKLQIGLGFILYGLPGLSYLISSVDLLLPKFIIFGITFILLVFSIVEIKRLFSVRSDFQNEEKMLTCVYDNYEEI